MGPRGRSAVLASILMREPPLGLLGECVGEAFAAGDIEFAVDAAEVHLDGFA
jgi:hypothetical protein